MFEELAGVSDLRVDVMVARLGWTRISFSLCLRTFVALFPFCEFLNRILP